MRQKQKSSNSGSINKNVGSIERSNKSVINEKEATRQQSRSNKVEARKAEAIDVKEGLTGRKAESEEAREAGTA